MVLSQMTFGDVLANHLMPVHTSLSCFHLECGGCCDRVAVLDVLILIFALNSFISAQKKNVVKC